MTIQHLKARPTTYRGVRMRSRLEATFAQHCDAVGLAWEYEPECFADETGQYLPDFKVSSGITGDDYEYAYVEVKPTASQAELARPAMQRVWSSDRSAMLVSFFPDTEPTCSEAWSFRWQSPPERSWEAILRRNGHMFDANDFRIDIYGEDDRLRVELVPDEGFASSYRRYRDALRRGERPEWSGGYISIHGVPDWRLVGPRTPTDLWFPKTIEVSRDGVATDTYGGQSVFMSPLWGHLVGVSIQHRPYRR